MRTPFMILLGLILLLAYVCLGMKGLLVAFLAIVFLCFLGEL